MKGLFLVNDKECFALSHFTNPSTVKVEVWPTVT